ncbi:MAG: recombinase family protein, partial [Candidatus Peregrinibacteria bacterium]|nr:recombinase family protein [Candidatus Peregrinibacteria bacterium]
IEIIHEEADEGKTGLLANRPGFVALFENWIENEAAPPFEYILVYDVSRWGRFQNQNEPAHYEFRCTLQDKKVTYIEDGFPKEDQQLIGSLQTAVKRYMAAEYSRQLSNKVFHGCMKVSEQGYSAGGTPCFGMARELLDEHKNPIRILKRGEHKEISNQRVRFVPLNDETTDAVRDIFTMFVQDEMNLSAIASHLNYKGIPSATGGLWNRDKLVRILMNETYTGARIYNKTWNRLRQGKRDNPRHEWIICRDTFPPIVSREMFEKAQERLWFMLGKWKQGRRAMKDARTLMLSGIKEFFTGKGMSEDDLFFVCHDFPVVLCVTSEDAGVGKEWCFLLPEELRCHEYVLGIGVVAQRHHPIDQFFAIPTEKFGVGGIFVLKEMDELYAQYAIGTHEIEQCILKLLNMEEGADQFSYASSKAEVPVLQTA